MKPEDKIVMYHYVRDVEDTDFPEIKACSIDRFSSQVTYLSGKYYCVTLGEYMKVRKDRLDKPYCVLTFDDGLKEHGGIVLSVLREAGIYATFFIITRPVCENWVASVHKVHFLLSKLGPSNFLLNLKNELNNHPKFSVIKNTPEQVNNKWDNPITSELKSLVATLSEEVKDSILSKLFREFIGDEKSFSETLYLKDKEIKDMSNEGFEIGAHTHSHILLSLVSVEKQKYEVVSSIEYLQNIIGKPLISFSYPNGVWSKESEDLLINNGIKAAVTVEFGLNSVNENQYRLKRYDTNDVEMVI